jgi:hypothetical protein
MTRLSAERGLQKREKIFLIVVKNQHCERNLPWTSAINQNKLSMQPMHARWLNQVSFLLLVRLFTSIINFSNPPLTDQCDHLPVIHPFFLSFLPPPHAVILSIKLAFKDATLLNFSKRVFRSLSLNDNDQVDDNDVEMIIIIPTW